MADRLDRVQAGEAIRADAWNKVVDAINSPMDVSITRCRRAPAPADGVKIKLVKLKNSTWTLDPVVLKSHATARAMIISPRTGQYIVDTSDEFEVWSVSSDSTTRPKGMFYAIYRNERWEALDKETYVTPYSSGTGISITSGEISNTGLIKARVPGITYQNYGELIFDKMRFVWVVSSEDIVGKKEISIKYTPKSVVTDVKLKSDGSLEVTRETVNVLG